MHCEFCQADEKSLVLVQLPQADGRLDTISCRACAVAQGLYCQQHELAHLFFSDDATSVCLECARLKVRQLAWTAELYLAQIQEQLPKEERDVLVTYLKGTSHRNESLALRLLRELVFRAIRSETSVEAIMLESCQQRTIDPIVIRATALRWL